MVSKEKVEFAQDGSKLLRTEANGYDFAEMNLPPGRQSTNSTVCDYIRPSEVQVCSGGTQESQEGRLYGFHIPRYSIIHIDPFGDRTL